MVLLSAPIRVVCTFLMIVLFLHMVLSIEIRWWTVVGRLVLSMSIPNFVDYS